MTVKVRTGTSDRLDKQTVSWSVILHLAGPRHERAGTLIVMQWGVLVPQSGKWWAGGL